MKCRVLSICGIILDATSGCGSAGSAGLEQEGNQSEFLAAPDGNSSTSTSGSLSLQDWQGAVQANNPSKAGCFEMTYPSKTWAQVPCAAPPARAVTHGLSAAATASAQGSSGGQVGNGNDWAATVSGTTIQTVQGNFPSVSNVTSETDLQTGIANSYCFQANSQFFSTPACGGYPGCVGWQQFEYSSVTVGGVFIEYWMFNYGGPFQVACPSGWQQWDATTCHLVSTVIPVPQQSITSLRSMQLNAVASPGLDSVSLIVGSKAYTFATDPTTLSLNAAWTQVEFNVVGDWNATQAQFNAGASVEVQAKVATASGTTTAPGCIANAGTTGETNNLSLSGPCNKVGGNPGKIWFFEHD